MIDVAEDATTCDAAGPDETEMSASGTPTEHAFAWALDDGDDDSDGHGDIDDDDGTNRHGWRLALLRAAGVLGFFLAGAAVIVAVWRTDGRHVAPPQRAIPLGPSSTAAAPPSRPIPVDDDEYVAMALSPSSLENSHHRGGAGTAGSQDQANRIAVSECRAGSGKEDCLLVNAGMYHGCVGYGIDSSQTRWVGAAGPDAAAAREDGARRLGVPGTVAVQCSDPPGIIKPAPATNPSSTPAEAIPTKVVQPQPTAPPSPTADQTYVALVSQIPGVVITDPAMLVAGGPLVCANLASQTRMETERGVQANDPGFTLWQASAVVDAAIAAYCPQYRG